MVNITITLAFTALIAAWFAVARRGKSGGFGFFARNMVGGFIGFGAMIVVIMIMTGGGNDDAVVVDYQITKDESLGTIKRSVEVLIQEPLDEATLEHLANKIRDGRVAKYDRTFIGWRVVGLPLSPYWATTHFNPDLEVKIWDYLFE